MPESTSSQPEPAPLFGSIRNPSESFGTVPHLSETFRSVPNASASFRTVPNASDRTASHTLTVREVARMFEDAGVSRTERSIVNWCLPNKHDVARLDGVFDANERKWFITQESVERAIAEEQARAARHNEPLPNHDELVRKDAEESIPNVSEPRSKREASHEDDEAVDEMNKKLRDLEITNRVKDAVIKKLEDNLESADEERRGYIQQLIEKSHQIGSLETQLRQIAAPRNDPALPNGSEQHDPGETTFT